MRVVFLTHNFPRYDGDVAGSFLLRLAVALRRVGVAVRVLAPSSASAPPHDEVQGIEVERFRYAPRALETIAYTGNMAADVRRSWGARAALGGLVVAGARAVAREARRWNADVVHAHWWFPAGLSATMPGVLGGRPLVVTSHGSDIRLARSIKPARPLFTQVARRASAYTFVSRWLRDEARALDPSVRGEVAPMPVAVDRFVPPAADTVRDGLLFVGRLNEQKGAADLLRAAALQRRAAPITIVGDGPDGPALHALAESLGIAHRVRWLPAVTQAELAERYRSARALVAPYREEGLGLVAVEATLCETPVVAYASGGLVDAVSHDVGGLLVPAGDVAALANGMDRLAGDDALARRLGRAGRPLALATFGPAAVADRYRAIYERVVAERAAR